MSLYFLICAMSQKCSGSLFLPFYSGYGTAGPSVLSVLQPQSNIVQTTMHTYTHAQTHTHKRSQTLQIANPQSNHAAKIHQSGFSYCTQTCTVPTHMQKSPTQTHSPDVSVLLFWLYRLLSVVTVCGIKVIARERKGKIFTNQAVLIEG